MSHSWGYKSAAKMGKEMGFTSPKVAVKAHTRAPRVAIKSAPSVPQVQPVKLASGGSVKKTSSAKSDDGDGFLDKKRDSITDDRRPGEKLSIRELGDGIKEGAKNTYRYTRDSIKAFPDSVDIKNYAPSDAKKAKGGSVSGYARGGAVKHDDAKQDRAMVKSMVKPAALKAKGGAMKKHKK